LRRWWCVFLCPDLVLDADPAAVLAAAVVGVVDVTV
jgi:hypothetical protein